VTPRRRKARRPGRVQPGSGRMPRKPAERPRVRRRFSQHFLEPAWVSRVVEAIAPRPDDVFLEVGAGTGRLTLPLASMASRLVAIEIDRDLVARLAPALPPNATIVSADVLGVDLAELLRLHAGMTAGGDPVPVRIAGNLPYGITSPILFRLLALQAEFPCHDATLMVQREVGDRLAAEPGTSEYGVLSVLVQLRASVVKLLTLPPAAFRPAPAVSSAVVRLTFHPPRVVTRDPAAFERLVRSVFMQRRKTLTNALRRFAAGTSLGSAEALSRAELDGRRRPETLEIVELARLAEVFASAND
jgi:16S rRNA (adenine1518-N6/adenine1519-N6)-dimethyltransferase